ESSNQVDLLLSERLDLISRHEQHADWCVLSHEGDAERHMEAAASWNRNSGSFITSGTCTGRLSSKQRPATDDRSTRGALVRMSSVNSSEKPYAATTGR